MLRSDVSNFNRRGSDGRLGVQKHRGEKFNPRYTTPVKQVNTAGETLWCGDIFRDMEFVPFTIPIQIQ